MYAACKAMDLKEGDEVLTPAFDCDATLSPFRALGYKLKFYRSNPYTFEADIDDIKKRITPGVKLIHVINHFGMPQPWDELLTLRGKTGIPIMEDNAFSLFSRLKNRYFGTFGDVSIFSLYKMLPLIDGGMLRINNPSLVVHVPERKTRWFYPTERKKVLGMIITELGVNNLGLAVKRLLKRSASSRVPLPPLFSDRSGYPEWALRDEILHEFSCDYLRPISRLARFQLSGFSRDDFQEIADRIRMYYFWLVNRLKDFKGIRILWPEIPEGVVPSCVSVLIDSHRDDFLQKLSEKRYGVMAWPTLSMEVIKRLDEFDEMKLIGRKILQIHLSAFRVMKKHFPTYLESLVNEFQRLTVNFFKEGICLRL